MRRYVGIILFGIWAAFFYYVHYGKVANMYARSSVKIEKVSPGAMDVTVNAGDCAEIARYEGYYVNVVGKVKKVLGNRIVLGCLDVYLHEGVKVSVHPEDELKVRGFIKQDRGHYFVDVWDERFISLSSKP